MRQLSRLFMILSALCFAMPAFAQGGGTSEASWIAITAGFSMAIASAVCGLAQGQGRRGRDRVTRPQSCRPTWNSVRPDSGSGTDRVAGAVHPGDHLPEGQSSVVSALRRKASASAEAFDFGLS